MRWSIFNKRTVSKILRFILKIIFVFIPFAYLGATLCLFLLEFIVDRANLEPWNHQGRLNLWVKVIIASCSATTAFGAWKLSSLIDGIQSKFLRFVALLAFLWINVGLVLGGATVYLSALEGFASQKRLAKVIAFHGISEDMCQALRIGMSEADVRAIMGEPYIKDPISPLYCPKSNPCRTLTYDSQKEVMRIQCWDGSER